MANTNIINAVFGSGICAVTTSAFRANYGMVLRFSGIDLPTAFECDFSNYDVMGRDSITAIGQNNEVQIPDDLWDSGLNIYAYVYLHPTDDSGVTVYTVTIPVLGRPNRTEEEPTPHEQTVIEQAISALNDAVEQTAADVVAADASAQAAAQSEANASVSERSAAASASAALASQNAAESAAQSATESASGAAESARNAAQSASQAAQSATAAQASAEQAEQSAQSIEGDVERAERAAATATDKATEAASSASTASGKANEASASATAAANSATAAASSAQNAASSAQSAESSATDANAAKTDAQDAKEAAETAQAAAEQAAQSVSGLSEQIAQNTADIADLVQTKAGALIDTASGSIASFVPDSTIPTVKGLTVDIEPVQDLHGYDNPWPAGGGKNLFDQGSFPWNNSQTIAYVSMPIPNGTYTFSTNFASNATRDVFVFAGQVTSGADSKSNGVDSSTPRTITIVDGYWTLATRYNSARPKPSEANWQLESGSTATTWTPYSNICPISGWDAVEVKHSGADMTNPTTYTIQLGQTVYGCKIYATQGKMVVDRAMRIFSGDFAEGWYKSDNGYFASRKISDAIDRNSNPLYFQSNLYKYSSITNNTQMLGGCLIWGCVRVRLSDMSISLDDWKAQLASTPMQVVYTLATPITVDLTPLEISVLTGQTNNIWADSGDVSVEYAADLKTYINNKIAAAVAALS